MKVRANTEYIYYPNMLDRIDGRTSLVPGSVVKVVNLPGCPKANTMQHAHVEYRGQFAGLVHTNSLHTMAQHRPRYRRHQARHGEESRDRARRYPTGGALMV